MAEVGIASQNVLDVWAGYNRDAAGFWEPETPTPTRLEDRPTVTLRLARLRDGKVGPYADDPDLRRAWALSEVRVAKYRIAICPPPPGLQSEIEFAAVLCGAVAGNVNPRWSCSPSWPRKTTPGRLPPARRRERISWSGMTYRLGLHW